MTSQSTRACPLLLAFLFHFCCSGSHGDFHDSFHWMSHGTPNETSHSWRASAGCCRCRSHCCIGSYCSSQQLQQQASTLQQVRQEMLNMRTHHDATVSTLQNTLQQTINTVATAKASNKTLVDNKGIGKPNNFDSDMKKFPNFSL